MGQCTATSRKGKRCRMPAIRGGTVCRMHGGSAPQVRAAANRRLALNTYINAHPQVDPHTTLLEEVRRTAGHVRALEAILSDLNDEQLVWGQTREVHAPDGTTRTLQAARNLWLELYQGERAHLLRACHTAVSCGVEQKRVEMEQQHGQLLADVIRRVLDDPQLGLDAGRRHAARRVAARHLRALESGNAG